MPISIVSIIIFVGLALIVIALLGGGIEVREIKIPALQIVPRVLSFLLVAHYWLYAYSARYFSGTQ